MPRINAIGGQRADCARFGIAGAKLLGIDGGIFRRAAAIADEPDIFQPHAFNRLFQQS